MGKGAVEAVEMALVLHHGGAGEIVERLHVIGGETGGHAFEEGQVLAEADRDTGLAQGFVEGNEHGGFVGPRRGRNKDR